MLSRKPDIVIGDQYLERWYIVPRNRWFNIYLHKFVGSDDDRALHDHPWWSLSVLLAGEIKEHQFNKIRMIPRWWPVVRSARFAHRLEVVHGPVWTVFITGPRRRDWGFHCRKGWRHWREFTDHTGNRVGAGCGEHE